MRNLSQTQREAIDLLHFPDSYLVVETITRRGKPTALIVIGGWRKEIRPATAEVLVKQGLVEATKTEPGFTRYSLNNAGREGLTSNKEETH